MTVVMPGATHSGKNRRKSACATATTIVRPNSIVATKSNTFSGVSLNERMPRFAHPIFRSRLFVDRPNIRSGRT